MASLYDQIKQNLSRGPGGQLSSTSSEELQSASQAMERPTVPTVPSEAAALTQNPDVAKMAGTPNNLSNAIRQSVRKEMDRSTVERTQQPSKTLTEADKAKQQQQQTLEQNIQDLPSRVQNLARQQFQQATSAGAAPTVDTAKFDAARPPTASDADWATAKGLASKIASGTATTQDIASLQNIMGTTVDAASIAKWLGGEQEAVQAAIANALPDTAMLSEVYPEPEKIQAIASALGIAPEQVSGMSFKQFQDAVKTKQDKDFNETNKLRQMAVDPNLSPAERDAARRQLKDMGASGLSSVERDAASVEERIASGDQISFNGQQMGIEEALSDDNLKGTVARYFQEPDFASKLATQEPDLAALIENNKSYFEQQAKAMEPTLAEFSRIQEYNKSLNNVGEGVPPVSDEVMKQLIPDWGKASGSQFQAPPLLNAVKQFSAADKASLVANINKFASYPELMSELATLDANTLAKEGFLDASGRGKVDQLLNAYMDYKQAENLAPAATVENDVRGMLGLGSAEELADIEDKLDDYWTLINLGQDKDGSIANFINLVDANRDGKVDSPAQIIAKAKDYISGGKEVSLKTLLERGVPDPTTATQKGLGAANKTLSTLQDKVSRYKEVLGLDGTVNPDKVKSLTLNEAIELESLNGKNATIAHTINEKAKEETTKLVSPIIAKAIASGNMASGDAAAVDEMYQQLKVVQADPNIPQIVKDKFKEQYYAASKMQQTYVGTQNNAKALSNQISKDPKVAEQVARELGFTGKTTIVTSKMEGVGGKFGGRLVTETVVNPEYAKFLADINKKLQQAASGSQNADLVNYVKSISKFRK